jgi:DNA repair exonuclease SbcCD ATPase subunit
MPSPSRYDQENLELPEEELSSEHLDSQVQKAQEQLLSLKRQQDAIERQKRELEELARRQDQLQAGRSEMIEKFTRAMVVLEREGYEAQKRVELLHGIHDSFTAHLQHLESINPKAWEGLDVARELNKALSSVDDARAEYTKSLPKISPESDTDSGDPVAASAGFQIDYGHTEKDFLYWLKAGAAFTLPLVLVALLFIFIVYALLAP